MDRTKDTYCNEQVSFYNLTTSQFRFECVTGKNVARKVPVHYHESLCIGLITKGSREMVINGKPYTINENQIFIINPYEPHSIKKTLPHDYVVITIHGIGSNFNFQNHIQDPEAVKLFIKCCESLKSKDESCFSLDWNTFHSYLLSAHWNKSLENNRKQMDKALSFIQAQYQNPIGLDDIAREAALSRYHFCRQFRNQMGISPYNYLLQYRLCKSFQMLRNNHQVFDVAIETGFYDSSHFIRAFETFMMVSPKRYQADLNT